MANAIGGQTSNTKRTIRVKVDDYELRSLLATFSKMDDIAKSSSFFISFVKPLNKIFGVGK